MKWVKANELRIGNWVSWSKKTPCLPEFHGKKFQVRLPDFERPEYLDPIPLNPEILEKSGFTKNDDGTRWWNDTIGSMSRGNTIGFDIDDNESGSINLIPIVYVHQLQNIVHALTGTELTITL